MAIITQFSVFVNCHAEALRDKFVDFKGKKELIVPERRGGKGRGARGREIVYLLLCR
jgi:hypothetical protein